MRKLFAHVVACGTALVLCAPALAHHSAPATYSGTLAGGGAISFDVSATSTITSVTVTNVPTPCGPVTSAVPTAMPVQDHSFTGSASFGSINGSFTRSQQAQGSLTIAQADPSCFTFPMSWTATTTAPPPVQCGDGDDNDDDGRTDFPADPDCTSTTDADERAVLTLNVSATPQVRKRKLDLTRFVIESAGGEIGDDAPALVLQRGKTKITVDLEIDGTSVGDGRFNYSFVWSCGRGGNWKWTATARRGAERVVREGTFTAAACKVRAWLVSLTKIRNDFARDFDRTGANALRCSPRGTRRGSLASAWRCVMVRRGFTCRGGFSFRYSRTFQSGEQVGRRRVASGGVECRS